MTHLWPQPIFGAEDGIATSSDALVSTSADGVDLNVVWQQVAQAIQAWNDNRDSLASVLSYWHTQSADAIPQSRSLDNFERASEMGEPTALRPPAEYSLMGFTFDDFDKAARWTRRALRDSTQEQILATLNYALEADNRLVNNTILNRLFSPVAEENSHGHTCYGLYNGDSMLPPEYLGKTFDSPHTHYLVSGGAEIDSGDLETLIHTVTEHGYGDGQLLLLTNPEQAETVASFRANVENNNDMVSKHDFIPSAGAPPYFSPQEIVGQIAPESFQGLKIGGSFGPAWVVSTDFIPAGYVSVVATYGANNAANAIGVREHPQAQYQGFRVIPGPDYQYPLRDAFYTRSFGVGVRRRGQAAVMQIKETGDYVAPTFSGLPL